MCPKKARSHSSTVFTCLGTVLAGSTFTPTPAPVVPPSPPPPVYPCLTAGYTYTIKQVLKRKEKGRKEEKRRNENEINF